jgi:hypothetical protein
LYSRLLSHARLSYTRKQAKETYVYSKRDLRKMLWHARLLWETGLFIGLFFSICGMLGILVGL